MPSENDKRDEEIQGLLTQLDLHYHSLRLVGQELISESGESSASSGRLNDKALELSKECSKVIQALYDRVDSDDRGLSESALNRIELAIRRASESRTQTLRAVQIWRAIETADGYLASISPKYGYMRLSQQLAVQALEGAEEENDQLASLFREYKEAMATHRGTSKPVAVPFAHGILRWRGSHLYYLERMGRGVRWIELDPEYEGERVDDDEEPGLQLVEAKTIEGYLIRLTLDPIVDEAEVDRYLQAQRLSPYIVTGAQIAREQKRRTGRKRQKR